MVGRMNDPLRPHPCEECGYTIVIYHFGLFTWAWGYKTYKQSVMVDSWNGESIVQQDVYSWLTVTAHTPRMYGCYPATSFS